MPEKRKPSYAQALALERATAARRASAARRRREREPVRVDLVVAPVETAVVVSCPECERTRRHDEFCSRPVDLSDHPE